MSGRRAFRPLLARLESRTTPATFTVLNLANDGPGSLRQAVLDAEAAAGADSIVFTAGLTGTINLGSELKLTEAVTITGPGAASITLNGTKGVRHFAIDGAAPLTPVAVSGLSLVNGRPNGGGGAVLANSADLALTDVVISGNVGLGDGAVSLDTSRLKMLNSVVSDNTVRGGNGGGIAASYYCDVEIRASVISGNRARPSDFGTYGNGGGIALYNNCTLLLEDSVVSGNVAEASPFFSYGGGGVQALVYCDVTVVRSTISGNHSNGDGGGLAVMYYSVAEITNSTISGNTARGNGGGVHFDYTDAGTKITATTIANNTAANAGGGVFLDSAYPLTVLNTIVSGNTAKANPDFDGEAYADFSAFGNSAGANVAGSGNLLDTPIRLGLLTDGYGGTTPTHLPAAGSPARDAGPATLPQTTDQRGTGFPRLVGPATDIGAVESTSGRPVAFPNTFAPVTAKSSLPYAVSAAFFDDTGIDAAKLGDGDVRVTGPNGFDVPAKFLTASSSGPGELVANFNFAPPGGEWDAGDNGVYSVRIAANAIFDTAGNSVAPGVVGTITVGFPATYVVDATNDEANDTDGKLSLREAIALANESPTADIVVFDPLVFAAATTITLTGEVFVNDSVSVVGPGAGLLTIDADQQERHFTINLGTPQAPVGLSGLTLTNGKTGGQGGGAVFNENAALTVDGVVMTKNVSSGSGGAIRLGGLAPDASLVLINSFIVENVVTNDDGGGISAPGGNTVVVRDSYLHNNAALGASGDGGGIAIRGAGSLTVESSTVSGNLSQHVGADFGGGGIYASGSGNVTVTNSTISTNTTKGNGGGVLFRSTGTFTLTNSTVTANNADETAGGVLLGSNVMSAEVVSSVIAGNTGGTTPDILGVATVTNAFIGELLGTQVIGTPLTGDAKLGPLVENGGPVPTHRPLAGSPLINAGANPLALANDQRGAGFPRVLGSAADIGAIEVSATLTANVSVNGGAAQRSRVTEVKVTFSEPAVFSTGVAAAVVLTRTGPGGPTGVVPAVYVETPTAVTLTFNDATFAPEGGSLIDGRYTLTIVAANVQSSGGGGFDGNGDGTTGDDYVSPANLVFRLFGDGNGDAAVNFGDFLAFRAAFGTKTGDPGFSSAFDFEGNGSVDFNDFLQFRARFGVTLP